MKGLARFSFFFFFFFFFTVSNGADIIAVNQSISDGETIVSAGDSFELGFFSPKSSSLRYVGIWYKFSNETVVWVANREAPLNDTSGVLQVTSEGILVLHNSTNVVLWSTNTSRQPQNPVAQLLDSGNLVVREAGDTNEDDYLWESFGYPGRVFLPGINFGRNLVTGLDTYLVSWKSNNDPSLGDSTTRLDPGGYPQIYIRVGENIVFRSGPWNGLRFSGMPNLKPNPIYTYGFVYNEKEICYRYDLTDSSVVSHMLLTNDGVLQRFTWTNTTRTWNLYLTAQMDNCFYLDQIMASSSSDQVLKPEVVGVGCGGGGAGRETSEAAVIANDQLLLFRGLKKPKKERGCTAKERISKMPPCTAGKRSSIYRGVTRHRWTGRYEAHLWDKSTWNHNQNKKGKQVYLGAYDDEEAAARAYDLAALKYWGPGTLINFPVTDYKRDLEEMQNVSREEYLASLRRKSSGFSRGLSKYRALSSQWDSSCSRKPGSEYCSSVNYGDDRAAESEYGGSFCSERKIDLTGYIKWWNSHSTRQVDSITKSSEDTKHGCPDDFGSELKTSEREVKCTQPYQMPHLGLSAEGKRHKGTISALSILSQSAAYKSLQEKASKKQETSTENDENENKNTVNKMDRGKAVEKSTSHDVSSERLGGATLGMTGGLSLQRNVYPLTPFLSAPLLTNYNTMDPLVDPILWTSLVPALPTGLSRNPEVKKTETSSTYSFFRPEE